MRRIKRVVAALIASATVATVAHASPTFYMRAKGVPTPAPAACSIQPTSAIPAGMVGDLLGVGFRATQSGNAPLGFGIEGPLPPGMTFDASRAVLAGTPTAPGRYGPISVVVNRRAGIAGEFCRTAGFEIVVAPRPIEMSVTPSRGRACSAYTLPVIVGGVAPRTFSIAPPLSNGLSLDAATGRITGTPNAASSLGPFVLSATDAQGASGSTSPFRIEVDTPAPLTVSLSTSTPTAKVGTAWTVSAGAAGGTGSYTYAIAPALPAGLTFDTATGRISGTPTTAGSFGTFTVTARDRNCAATGAASVTITVEADTPVLTSNVYTWGDNAFGSLGYAASAPQTRPRLVEGVERLAEISVGDKHICGVSDAGDTWCWGDGTAGALGNGSTASSVTPIRVARNLSLHKISAGENRTCAVTKATGELYCWGQGAGLTPQKVTLPGTVKDVSTKFGNTCATTGSAGMYCWGSNEYGWLGNGSTVARSDTPVMVSGSSGGVYENVQLGLWFGCADKWRNNFTIKDTHCWGIGRLGQMGNGTRTDTNRSPVRVSFEYQISGVVLGSHHACAMATDAWAWPVKTVPVCWGLNAGGSLGNAIVEQYVSYPAGVDTTWFTFNREDPVALFAGGGVNTCATTTGRTYCWGANLKGSNGNGRITGYGGETFPAVISTPSFASVQSNNMVSAGLAR